MKVDRRTFLALAGIAAVPGLPALAENVDPVSAEAQQFIEQVRSDHPLFATHRIPGASWVSRNIAVTVDMSDDAIARALERGIDLVAEANAALRLETITEYEQAWMAEVEASAATRLGLKYTQSDYLGEFAGEQFAYFGDMLMDADPAANTAIISATALTLLQAAFGGPSFQRFEKSLMTSTKPIGVLRRGERVMTIICDVYRSDTAANLVGFVPEPKDRRAALVQTGLTTYEFGTLPGHADGWTTVHIDIPNLTFV